MSMYDLCKQMKHFVIDEGRAFEDLDQCSDGRNGKEDIADTLTPWLQAQITRPLDKKAGRACITVPLRQAWESWTQHNASYILTEVSRGVIIDLGKKKCPGDQLGKPDRVQLLNTYKQVTGDFHSFRVFK